MRHRTVRWSPPAAYRSRFGLASRADAATSVAGRVARMPAGEPSAPNAGADGALLFGYEVPIP